MSEALSPKTVPLGELVKPTRPRVQPADYLELPFIGMEHVEAHTMRLLGSSSAAQMKSAAIRFFAGDVLYGRLRPYLNKVVRPSFGGLCSAEFIVFPESERLSGKYLQYFLNSARFVEFASQLNAGDRPRVDFRQIADFGIPLRTLAEQNLIVAEIEKQFSRLERAISDLQRARDRLRNYKEAVLEAAISGRLVMEGDPEGGRPTQLSRVQNSTARWILEEHLSGWPKGVKYREPVAPDPTLELSLPNTWARVSWDAVLSPEEGSFRRGPFGSALTKSIFVSSGYKVYEQYCPINDDCSFGRYYITPEKFAEMKSFAVKAGDFLISCSGVSLGRITQVPEEFEAGVINQALLRVRINPAVMHRKFFLILFRSPRFQSFLFERSAGAAIPNLRGVAELKAIPVPVPPLAEQERIVAEVERRLSISQGVERQVELNLKRAQALRQAVLARAFDGAANPKSEAQPV